MQHKSLLNKLADQYETVDFLQGDPAWFMHQVVGKRNQETMAFIASCLSYGARKAFLPRIQHLLDCSHAEPYEWILKGKYRLDIPDDDRCYYRLYSNSMMIDLFQALQRCIRNTVTWKTTYVDMLKRQIKQNQRVLSPP